MASSTETISLKKIKELYLLTNADVQKLTKPYRLVEVEQAAINKFGSKEKLQEAISNRNDERERKKIAKLQKDQLKESNRKVAEDTLRKKLLSFNTGNNNDYVLVKEENLNWLINTNVGQQCIDKLMLSKMPNDDAKLDVNAVNTLLSFSRNANERCFFVELEIIGSSSLTCSKAAWFSLERSEREPAAKGQEQA